MSVTPGGTDTFCLDAENPWPGLVPYREDHAAWFYGRDAEAEELLRRVVEKNFTLLFGQSGLGKTSLLSASLYPRLRGLGFLPVELRLDVKSPEPLMRQAVLQAAETIAAAAPHIAPPRAGDSLWVWLHRADVRFADAAGEPVSPVLVFDQFEEFFTLGGESAAARLRSEEFLRDLADVVENRPPAELDAPGIRELVLGRQEYRVLLVMREDYLAGVEGLVRGMRSAAVNRMRLVPMSGVQALAAVNGPAVGLISPAVSRQIVRFIAGSESVAGREGEWEDFERMQVDPSLLSMVCRELNEQRKREGEREIRLEAASLTQRGEALQVIVRNFYERCLEPEHPAVRSLVEERLTTRAGFRENVSVETAEDYLRERSADPAALGRLVDRRLLRLEERLQTRRVELAHDALTATVVRSRSERRSQQEARAFAADVLLDYNLILEELERGAAGSRHLHDLRLRAERAIEREESRRSGAGHLRETNALRFRLAEHALRLEEYALVCDLAQASLRPTARMEGQEQVGLASLRRLYASALLRLGYAESAKSQLQTALAEPALPARERRDCSFQLGETLFSQAQTAAGSVWQATVAEARAAWEHARQQGGPDDYMSMLQCAEAAALLRQPHEEMDGSDAFALLSELDRLELQGGPCFHTGAARALAWVLLNRVEEAAGALNALSRLGDATILDLAEVRHHTSLLAESHGQPRDFYHSAFPRLELIVFHGDPAPARADGEYHRELVRSILADWLKIAGAGVAFCGASPGGDLLFAERMLQLGGELRVILPWSAREFRRARIGPCDTSEEPFWNELFSRVMEQAREVRELGQPYEPGSTAGNDYARAVCAGTALRFARQHHLDLRPVLLSNLRPGEAEEAIAFLDLWRRLGSEPTVLPLPPVPASRRAPDRRLPAAMSSVEQTSLRQEVKSVLFADIVGYSQLTEFAMPASIRHFLGCISRLVAISAHAPASIQTWGDAFFAVFDYAADAGAFAAELQTTLLQKEKDWLSHGLYWEEASPEGQPIRHALSLRVGLHAGPLFAHQNPLTRQQSWSGTHMNLAARVEPLARPGEIVATEEFAALAEAGSQTAWVMTGLRPSFTCEYAGSLQLSRHSSSRLRVYQVRKWADWRMEALAKSLS